MAVCGTGGPPQGRPLLQPRERAITPVPSVAMWVTLPVTVDDFGVAVVLVAWLAALGAATGYRPQGEGPSTAERMDRSREATFGTVP